MRDFDFIKPGARVLFDKKGLPDQYFVNLSTQQHRHLGQVGVVLEGRSLPIAINETDIVSVRFDDDEVVLLYARRLQSANDHPVVDILF